jgi:hypothetical protein
VVFAFSAATILLVALRCIWGVWNWRDFSEGDTAGYYYTALKWASEGVFDNGPRAMVFSPLYTVFYSWFVRLWPDALTATMMHRVVLVLATSLVVWAAARRVLPRAWAWLAAVWWVVLPVNWNAYYEVHLFGFALLAGAAALAGGGSEKTGCWWRGGALALLLVAACLVRNEFLPAAALFVLWCLWKAWRRGGHEVGREVFALSVPTIVTALAALWMFSGNRDQISPSKIVAAFETRQRANLRQVYSFGYQQRHREWKGDPWIGNGELMTQEFGRPDPLFSEAFRANPQAMAEHVLWNLSLVPSGLRFGMCGGYSGKFAPDFGETKGRSSVARVLSYIVLGLWLCGVAWCWRRRTNWPGICSLAGSWSGTWVALGCMLPSVCVAIITQRPRPSYIFPLSFFLILLTVWFMRQLAGAATRKAWLPRSMLTLVPLALGVVLTLVVAPIGRPDRPARPLAEDYQRLKPYRDWFSTKAATFCTNARWSADLAYYLGNGIGRRMGTVSLGPGSSEGLSAWLASQCVGTFYLKADALFRPDVVTWRRTAPDSGWRLLGTGSPGAEWELWVLNSTRVP